MLEKLNAITDSLEKNCYLPALALSLTIPDICGEIEYPHLTHYNGKRHVGHQYSTWFNDWVSHHYADHPELIDKEMDGPYFTGEMCYKLRCSFLHSETTDLEAFKKLDNDKWVDDYIFNLCINDTHRYQSSWNATPTDNQEQVEERHIRIDIEDLCKYLVKAGYDYYHNKSQEAFQKLSIKAVNN